MDPQKPVRPAGVHSPAAQTTTTAAVTCQARAAQTSATIVSSSTASGGGYVLTSGGLRPMANYTLVAGGSQTPQFVVQSAAGRTAAIPQYVSAGGVRHVLSAGAGQSSNVTYVLPSGAHIVRMNNVITTSAAGDQRQGAQYVLTSSAQKMNAGVVSPLAQNAAETSPISSGAVTVSRNLGITTSASSILQRGGIHIPKLNTAYYSQVKGTGNEPTKISLRPKLNEQKPGTSYILTSNDWARAKNVPISSLQKVNANYMQIPLIQKPGTVLTSSAVKSNVNIQQQRPQQQSIRSVILPTNYRTAAVSQPQNTDCKLVLNSINVASQVLNSTDGNSNTMNTPVSNIQQLNANYLQFPIAQKPGSILTRTNLQPTTETNSVNNIRIGQQQTIRSVILPANYRTAMVSSPQKGIDYRLILKPVNIQSPQTNIIKNIPSSRFNPPRNASIRNTTLRPPSTSSARPMSLPIRVPITRLSTAKTQNEILADSKITPIPLRERENHLVISKKSIQICIDEINNKNTTTDQPNLSLTEPALELIRVEVTFRLFYLLRECKKVLIRSRSSILTEESVRQVCAEYFATFYGNKLWPLFCLKPKEDDSADDDQVWMRKHNNVNLIGWLKHPKFRHPSYIKKRHRKEAKKTELSLQELMKVSEVIYENIQPSQTNINLSESPPTARKFFQSLRKNQVPFNNILPKNSTNGHVDGHSPTDIQQTSEILPTTIQTPTTNITIRPKIT